LAFAEKIDLIYASLGDTNAWISQIQTVTIDKFAAQSHSINAMQSQFEQNFASIVSEQSTFASQLSSFVISKDIMMTSIGENAAAIQTESEVSVYRDEVLASRIDSVVATANSKNRTFFQSTQPADFLKAGDLWIHTGEGNKTYRYNGSAWESVDNELISLNAAAITEEKNVRTNQFGSLSKRIDDVTAVMGDPLEPGKTISASVQQNSTAIVETKGGLDGLQTTISAMHTIKVQTISGGKKVVAGIGLVAGVESEVRIRADKFMFTMPEADGGADIIPFVISRSGSTPILLLDGNMIATGSISSAKLATDAVTSRTFGTSEGTQIQLDGKGLIRMGGTASPAFEWNGDNNTLKIKGAISVSASGVEFPSPVFRGAYSPSATYYKGDWATYNGASWLYINSVAASGNTPIEGTRWTIYANKGDLGATGAAGAAGAAGENAVFGFLTNESHTVPASSTGVVSSYASSGSQLQVYEGSTLLTYHTTAGNGRYTVGTPVISPASAITVGARSGSNTTTCTVATHSGMANNQDVVTITYPVAVRRANGTTVNLSLVQTITKSKQGADGADGVAAKTLRLSATSQVFKYNSAGVALSGQSITFTALGQNLAGSTFSFTTNPSVKSQNTTTNTFTLNPTEFGTNQSVEVTVTRDGLSDHITVIKVQDGNNAIGYTMSNPAHTMSANVSGVVSSYAGSGGQIKVYDGVSELTFHTTLGVGRFTVGTPTVNPAGSITVGTRSGSGTTTCVIANHNSMSANSVTITFPITARLLNGSDVSFNIIQSLTKAMEGVAGIAGPSITYRGVIKPSTQYFNTQEIKDVVKIDSTYYFCKLTHTSPSTIGVVNPDHWTPFTGNFESIATDLLLTKDVVIKDGGGFHFQENGNITIGGGGKLTLQSSNGLVVNSPNGIKVQEGGSINFYSETAESGVVIASSTEVVDENTTRSKLRITSPSNQSFVAIGDTDSYVSATRIFNKDHCILRAGDNSNIGRAESFLFQSDTSRLAYIKTNKGLDIYSNLEMSNTNNDASMLLDCKISGYNSQIGLYNHATALSNNGIFFLVKDPSGQTIFQMRKNSIYPQSTPSASTPVSLGLPSYPWTKVYSKEYLTVADFYFFDERLDENNNRVLVDDLSILNGVKPSGNYDPNTGFAVIDDWSLPNWLFHHDTFENIFKSKVSDLSMKKKGINQGIKSLLEQKDSIKESKIQKLTNEKYEILKKIKELSKTFKRSDEMTMVLTEDGKPYLSTTTIISLLMGAVRQLDKKFEDYINGRTKNKL